MTPPDCCRYHPLRASPVVLGTRGSVPAERSGAKNELFKARARPALSECLSPCQDKCSRPARCGGPAGPGHPLQSIVCAGGTAGDPAWDTGQRLIAELGASRSWGPGGFGLRSQLMHPPASRGVGVPPQPPGGLGLPPCTPQPPKTLQRFGALGCVHFGGAPWHEDVGVPPPRA